MEGKEAKQPSPIGHKVMNRRNPLDVSFPLARTFKKFEVNEIMLKFCLAFSPICDSNSLKIRTKSRPVKLPQKAKDSVVQRINVN